MLPSTGHFMNINCPFYETCLCERPYCHFKHIKRESVNDTKLISELVSQAVNKILNINVNSFDAKKTSTVGNFSVGDGKNVTYKPTPIAELKKIKNNTTKKQEDHNWQTVSEFSYYSTNAQTNSPPLCATNSYKFVPISIESEDLQYYTEDYVTKKSSDTIEDIDQFIKECSVPNKCEIVKNTSEHLEQDKTKLERKKSEKKSSNHSKSSSKKSRHKKDEKHKKEYKQSKNHGERKNHENKTKREKHDHNTSERDKTCSDINKSSENVTNNNIKEQPAEDLSHLVTLELSSDSTDELEQCKKIFDDYKPHAENKQVKTCPKPKENEKSIVVKKRVAHDNSQNVVRKTVIKAPTVKSAAEVMADRYKQVRTNSIENITHAQNLQFKRQLNTEFGVKPTKMTRIAPVSNVNLLLNAKKTIQQRQQTVKYKTPVQSMCKGAKRIAHIPELKMADMPTVLHSEKSKLPVNVRNRYLFLMAKECIKLYINKQAAYDRALNEEYNCYSKCSAIPTYKNSVMLSINRLRKESVLDIVSSKTSVEKEDFAGENFYKNIIKWILTSEELLENGFPRPGSPKKGFAVFKQNKSTEKIPECHELCARCHKIFKIDEKGFQIYPDDCIYHPGKRFSLRGETTYLCCKESTNNSGCCIASKHVFEIRDPSSLSGFVATFEPENMEDPRSCAVYALDCEMVYTTKGVELARVTVINSRCDVVYETLVKPIGDVIDCNTRYSGIMADMLENITTKITDVQATLLLMFNSKTILIGHSLESDLKSLRLIHDTVIDTSVLFPHKLGPPKKRGLRSLASDYLKKIIQNDEGGHDSAEDAVTCMELIVWKLKEEMKLR